MTTTRTQSRFYFVLQGIDWDGEETAATWILDANQLPIAAQRIDSDWELARGVLAGFLRKQLFTMFEHFTNVEVAKVNPFGEETFRTFECGWSQPSSFRTTDGAWIDPENEIVVA